jgi:uncharacterized membrane protein YbaN (DUF454 family)
MNSQDAKTILGLYRGSRDAGDPQVAEALEQARRDPELGQWFEHSRAFHAAMKEKLQQIAVPPGLKQAILARNATIIRPLWWQQPIWLAAAAAIVLLLVLVAFWSQPSKQNRFSNYRSRMVSAALRQYNMDIMTNDPNEVRHYLAQHGAPADYTLPKGLEKLAVSGGGCLDWQAHPVSMVCFDRGDKKMLFLFVMARSAVKDPPPPIAEMAKVNKLLTESWSQDDKTYLLAGPEDSSLLRQKL